MILKWLKNKYKKIARALSFRRGHRSIVIKVTAPDSERIIMINMNQYEGDENHGGIEMTFDVIGGDTTEYNDMTPDEQLQYEFLNIILDGLKNNQKK